MPKPDDRLDEVLYTVSMIQWAQKTDGDQAPGIDPLLPTVGIMDWVSELHRLLEGGELSMRRDDERSKQAASGR